MHKLIFYIIGAESYSAELSYFKHLNKAESVAEKKGNIFLKTFLFILLQIFF